MKLTGIIPDPFTAFRDDYSFDPEAQRRHLTWLTEIPSVQIMSVAGGGGEGYSLTAEEFDRLVRIAVDVCHPRVKVMPNIHGESYEKVAQKIRIARDAGADGVRVCHPYYASYTPSNLYDYYADLSREFAEMPILLYPQVVQTARPFPIDVLGRLARINNIIGAKLSAYSLAGYSFWDLFKLHMLTRDEDFLIVPGTLRAFYYFCRAGIQSDVSIDGPLIQLAPDLCETFFKACRSGNWVEAQEGLDRLEEIAQGTTPQAGGVNRPASWKYASALLGRPVGPVRRPCSMPTPIEAEAIRLALARAGLLSTEDAVPA